MHAANGHIVRNCPPSKSVLRVRLWTFEPCIRKHKSSGPAREAPNRRNLPLLIGFLPVVQINPHLRRASVVPDATVSSPLFPKLLPMIVAIVLSCESTTINWNDPTDL